MNQLLDLKKKKKHILDNYKLQVWLLNYNYLINTGESITDGKMRVDVRYFGFPVYSQDHDLCEETPCPVTSGNFVVSHTEELPGFTPPVSDLYAFYIYFDECYWLDIVDVTSVCLENSVEDDMIMAYNQMLWTKQLALQAQLF